MHTVMDPLSIASGTIAVVRLATKVSTGAVWLSKKGRDFDAINSELQIYTAILEEVSTIALSGTTKLPVSATLSLQLCNQRLLDMNAQLQKLQNPEKGFVFQKGNHEKLENSLKYYRRYVKLLRAIVMERGSRIYRFKLVD